MQKLLLTAALFLFAPLTRAQTPTILPLPDIHSQQQLDATILALHNAYFGAYNTCDLAGCPIQKTRGLEQLPALADRRGRARGGRV